MKNGNFIVIDEKPIPSFPAYKIQDTAIVDDELWYTISTFDRECIEWICQNNSNLWYRHKRNKSIIVKFDIHEKLFTLLRLRINV